MVGCELRKRSRKTAAQAFWAPHCQPLSQPLHRIVQVRYETYFRSYVGELAGSGVPVGRNSVL